MSRLYALLLASLAVLAAKEAAAQHEHGQDHDREYEHESEARPFAADGTSLRTRAGVRLSIRIPPVAQLDTMTVAGPSAGGGGTAGSSGKVRVRVRANCDWVLFPVQRDGGPTRILVSVAVRSGAARGVGPGLVLLSPREPIAAGGAGGDTELVVSYRTEGGVGAGGLVLDLRPVRK